VHPVEGADGEAAAGLQAAAGGFDAGIEVHIA
jgi:hypothetical protein